MLLPINLLIIYIIASVWVPSGQSFLFQLLRLLLLLSSLFLTFFVATVVPDDDHVPWSQESYEEPRDVSVLWLSVSVQCPMPTRAFGRPDLVEALGFKCIICNAEFVTRRGADCHRRHPACSGTACADPSNMQSVSLTARSDVSVGLLRQHSAAPLGTCVILHSK
jgi:hypothetical protein